MERFRFVFVAAILTLVLVACGGPARAPNGASGLPESSGSGGGDAGGAKGIDGFDVQALEPLPAGVGNRTLDTIVAGQLVYNNVEEMTVGRTEIIEVFIADNTRAEVTARLQEELSGRGVPLSETIKMSTYMAVDLRADTEGAFDIVTRTKRVQMVRSDDEALWRWQVTPRMAFPEPQRLYIEASAIIPREGFTEERVRPAEVITVTVLVDPTVMVRPEPGDEVNNVTPSSEDTGAAAPSSRRGWTLGLGVVLLFAVASAAMVWRRATWRQRAAPHPTVPTLATVPQPLTLSEDRRNTAAWAATGVSYKQLYDILDDLYDLQELRLLCRHLGLDIEDLAGDSQAAKALALLEYMERHNRLAELIALVRHERPNAPWPPIPGPP